MSANVMPSTPLAASNSRASLVLGHHSAGLSARVNGGVGSAPAQLPVFSRQAPKPSPDYVVDRVVRMLTDEPARVAALIQALVRNHTTDGLDAAFRRKPDLLDKAMLVTLATCGAGKPFVSALALSPSLCDQHLVEQLRQAGAKERYIEAVLRTKPELRDA